MRTNYISLLGLTIQTVRNPKGKWLTPSYHDERQQWCKKNLLKQHGSTKTLLELSGKIKTMFKRLEQASAEYELFLELKRLQKTLEANWKGHCLENIEIMIKKRGKEQLSEPSCDYATLLEFESASCNSSFLHTSENERNPCMMGLEVKKAKREAQGHRKRSKSKPEPERQFQEHQHIRELKNEF